MTDFAGVRGECQKRKKKKKQKKKKKIKKQNIRGGPVLGQQPGGEGLNSSAPPRQKKTHPGAGGNTRHRELKRGIE